MKKTQKQKLIKLSIKLYVWLIVIFMSATILDWTIYQIIFFALDPVKQYALAEVNIIRKAEAVEGKVFKTYAPAEAKQRIIEIAEQRNFKDIDHLLKVINCESRFNQFSYHVNNDGSVDRGIAMWNDHWHSKMTNEQAFDLDYSINRTIDYFIKGSSNLWACDKIINLADNN
jgi:hypothetical protein